MDEPYRKMMSLDQDDTVEGFLKYSVDPLRYERTGLKPYESDGLILSLVPKGARVLDVGCGTGYLTALLKDHCGASIFGIEPNRDRAALASERGVTLIGNDLMQIHGMNSHTGKFNVILFSDVLEHLSNPSEVLIQAKKLLSSDGVVIASIPNVAHWTIRLNLLRGRFNYQPYGMMDATHLRWFTKSTVIQFFDSIGYKIDKIHFAAGTWLPEYSKRIFCLFPNRLRTALICKLANFFPELFACQFVLSARIIKMTSDNDGN